MEIKLQIRRTSKKCNRFLIEPVDSDDEVVEMCCWLIGSVSVLSALHANIKHNIKYRIFQQGIQDREKDVKVLREVDELHWRTVGRASLGRSIQLRKEEVMWSRRWSHSRKLKCVESKSWRRSWTRSWGGEMLSWSCCHSGWTPPSSSKEVRRCWRTSRWSKNPWKPGLIQIDL